MKDIIPMNPLTPQDKREFEKATNCNISGKSVLDGEKNIKDHIHITGKKRFGAAHSICNFYYKHSNFVPNIFHTLAGYDSHLFMKQLCSHGDKINAIAENKEKYISYIKNLFMHDFVDKDTKKRKIYLHMSFIDSLRFFPTSL